jgi:hypothetical protein
MGKQHLMTLVGENLGQQLADAHFVIHHQNLRHG